MKLGIKLIGAALFIGIGLWLIQVGKTVADAKNAGLLDETQTEKYQASRENNLKSIHRALMQAADSDGEFPDAAKWMETALIRLKTSDLTEEEAKNKLRVPGAKNGDFGYSFNAVFSKVHPGEIKVKANTILVFESKATTWNASGNPESDAKDGAKGVTFEGKVVDLPVKK